MGRGDQTRRAVVEAATARFRELGYDGATGALIAADVGVSEPTITHHFGSKAGLLAAVITAYYDELMEAMDAVLDRDADALERLRDFAVWWLVHNAENIDLLAVFGRHARGADDDLVATTFRDANRRVTRAFERLLEDGRRQGVLRSDLEPRLVRDLWFGGAEHLMLSRSVTGRPVDLASSGRALVEVLLRGVATPEPSDGARDPSVDQKLDQVLALLRQGGD